MNKISFWFGLWRIWRSYRRSLVEVIMNLTVLENTKKKELEDGKNDAKLREELEAVRKKDPIDKVEESVLADRINGAKVPYREYLRNQEQRVLIEGYLNELSKWLNPLKRG